MATSQNGYKALEPDETFLWKIPVKGPKRHLRLAPGNLGFILAHFALRFDETIEDINEEKTWDDWGYADRSIRNSTTLSNHASGTAEDLNATQHPLGAKGTFTRQQVNRIHEDLKEHYRGVIRWGGDYSGRKDEMHFEIVGSRYKVNRLARRLRKTPRGKRILTANNL